MGRTLALLGLLVWGCGDKPDDDDDDEDTGEDTGDTADQHDTSDAELAPDINVSPTEIDFGSVSLDGPPPPSASAVVTVLNTGTADLSIQDLGLTDPLGVFEVSALSAVTVAPGAEADFVVTFTPTSADSYVGEVVVGSSDPDEPAAVVTLAGEGRAPSPALLVSPTTHDFDAVGIGCEAAQSVTLSNVGAADLTVTEVSLTTATTELVLDDGSSANGALPWTVAPGASVEVSLSFTPVDEVLDSGTLSIASDDPDTPTTALEITAQGELWGSQTDTFSVTTSNELDLIFAIDRSCSMDDDISNLVADFGTLTTTLGVLGVDYQTAAVVEDSGCINGSDLFIDGTFSASDAESTLSTMINLGGSYGSNTERGFMLLEAALAETTASSGCNWGLVRPSAHLALVGMSDEPEQSVHGYAYYVSLFQTLKADPSDVTVHAIGGDYPSGCGAASAYTGFYEATVATGGSFHSICSTSWTSLTTTLAQDVAAAMSTAGQTTFALSRSPVPATVSVTVDGVSTSSYWSYEAADNQVVFDASAAPASGSVVEIGYALPGECDR
jgi:hypothetical protein